LLPNALVRSYFKFKKNRTVSPITNPKSGIRKSQIGLAGLFSVALVVVRLLIPNARLLSGSLPFSVQTFLFCLLSQKRLPDLFLCKAQLFYQKKSDKYSFG